MHKGIEGHRVRVSARETEIESKSVKNWGRQQGISSREGRGAAIVGEHRG
jgi:hypothetical protein